MRQTDAPVYGRSIAPSGPVVRALARPRALVIACVGALSLAAWLYTGLMVASAVGAGEAAALGPGMGVFSRFVDPGSAAAAWISAICATPLGESASAASPGSAFALVLAMWGAMTLAMMLPTAGPMLATYAELAESAARRNEVTPSPLILAAGYGAVWLGFALAAALVSAGLRAGGLVSAHAAPAGPWLAGLIFLNAGLYQFSALKHACLRACQRPAPFFFANWTTRAARLFRLGLRQGLLCLGCCWAAMLIMVAVGTMNVIWMAGLGMVMAIEKVLSTGRFSRVVGAVFLVIGAGLMVSVAAARLGG